MQQISTLASTIITTSFCPLFIVSTITTKCPALLHRAESSATFKLNLFRACCYKQQQCVLQINLHLLLHFRPYGYCSSHVATCNTCIWRMASHPFLNRGELVTTCHMWVTSSSFIQNHSILLFTPLHNYFPQSTPTGMTCIACITAMHARYHSEIIIFNIICTFLPLRAHFYTNKQTPPCHWFSSHKPTIMMISWPIQHIERYVSHIYRVFVATLLLLITQCNIANCAIFQHFLLVTLLSSSPNCSLW